MKDKIETIIRSYKRNIKNYSNCTCRGACNCEEVGRYTNSVWRTVIEDLQNLIEPPKCIRCGEMNIVMDKFYASDKRKVYFCYNCITSEKVYEEK